MGIAQAEIAPGHFRFVFVLACPVRRSSPTNKSNAHPRFDFQGVRIDRGQAILARAERVNYQADSDPKASVFVSTQRGPAIYSRRHKAVMTVTSREGKASREAARGRQVDGG